jgi:hypothetical protein
VTTISSKTILRSRNTAAPDKVLSTLLLRYPRWIHAEQRTHRVIPLDEGLSFFEPTPSLMADPNLSRNAASSRAIPVEKLIADALSDPAIPLFWGKNQRGMQAVEENHAPVMLPVPGVSPFEGETTLGEFTNEEAWMRAMHSAIEFARAFADAGYHKQIVNRLLEPFTHITVLVSATEWDNFLELRDHGDAEPHIRMLAQCIRACLDRTDDIQDLEPGGWHLPFITDADKQSVIEWDDGEENRRACTQGWLARNQWAWYGLGKLKKLSTSRCASTSYKTVDGFDMTLDRAIALHDKLVVAEPIHASPTEHVAQADDCMSGAEFGEPLWDNEREHGNFVGFRQYRHQL